MEDRIPLILVDLERGLGRSQRLVWELAARLSRQRFELQVWLSADLALDELAGALDPLEIPVARFAEIDSAWAVRARLALRGRLRRAHPRLIHLHVGVGGGERSLGTLLEGANGIPVVVTDHAVGGDLPAGTSSSLPKVLDRADAIAVSSAAEAEILAREQPRARGRVRVVPNGVEVPDLESEAAAGRAWRERLGAGPLRPLWVCGSRLERGKGQGVLLEALAMVRSRGLAFTAAFVGEGSLGAALEMRIRELGLADSVRLLGALDDPGPLLLAADAVVVPSAWESQPLVVLEAMARGRPVVASAVGGIPELIEDGINGRLCPAGDAVTLASILESFQRRPEAASRLGRHAAEWVLGSMTWDHTIATYEAVYDEVLGLATFVPEEREASRKG